MKPKVKTHFSSFLDIIAGSAGGGAIILVGLIVLILVLINRSVFYIVHINSVSLCIFCVITEK